MTTQTEPTYSICEIIDMFITFTNANDIDGLTLLYELLAEENELYRTLQIQWEMIRISAAILRIQMFL